MRAGSRARRAELDRACAALQAELRSHWAGADEDEEDDDGFGDGDDEGGGADESESESEDADPDAGGRLSSCTETH
jgi:hypothetical protein